MIPPVIVVVVAVVVVWLGRDAGIRTPARVRQQTSVREAPGVEA